MQLMVFAGRLRKFATLMCCFAPIIASLSGNTAHADTPHGVPFFIPPWDYSTNTGYGSGGSSSEFINSQGRTFSNSAIYVNGTPVGDSAITWTPDGSVKELQKLKVTDFTTVTAISDSNLSTGISSTPRGSSSVPLRWDAAGNVTKLAYPSDVNNASNLTYYTYGINSTGEVVGVVYTPNGIVGLRWNSLGSVVRLASTSPYEPTGSEHTNAAVNCINDAGQAGGMVRKFDSTGVPLGDVPVRWEPDGRAVELGNLGLDAVGGTVLAIAKDGTAAGQAILNDGVSSRALAWTPSGTTITLEDLGTKPAGTAGYDVGVAHCINDLGQAAGYSEKWVAGVDLGPRAVRWDIQTGNATELGVLGTSPDGLTQSYANAINNVGQIAGQAYKWNAPSDPVQGLRAVVWQGDGTALELDSLISPSSGWILSDAISITDNGWVAGYGQYDPDGAGPAQTYAHSFSLNLNGNSWTNASGGAWKSGSNWSNAIAPGSASAVFFDLPSTYTTNIASPATVSNCFILAGSVTLDVTGSSLHVSQTMHVRSTLAISGNGSVFADQGLIIGSAADESAGSIPAAQLDSASNTRIAAASPASLASHGSLTLRGATINAGITNYGHLALSQYPKVVGNVTNNGDMTTINASSNAIANVATITGNYTQGASGTLFMQVGGTSLGLHQQLNISGKASLAGTLDVSVEGSYVPQLGDVVPIIKYGSVSGRFNTFNGAVIKGTDGQPIPNTSDRFFGLLYGNNTLSVATLQVPQRANSEGSLSASGVNANDLVLLTHGWNANAGKWAIRTASDIQKALPVPQNWDVATMDWSQFSGNIASSPTTASEYANDIGESLANWMREAGISYKQLHLIGHSAGSWLINGLASGLKTQRSSTYIQETFLDAYNPPSISLNGYLLGKRPALGEPANYAEQYFDGLNTYTPGLATILKHAANYDVYPLVTNWYYNVAPVVGPHQWPYVWYDKTVNDPYGGVSAGGFGFANSIEYQNGVLRTDHTGYGEVQELDASGFHFDFVQYQPVVDLFETTHVTTGTVISDNQGGVILTSSPSLNALLISASPSSLPSGAPAIITNEVLLTSPANMISLTGQFLSSGHGLLTGYFDGRQIFQIDELDMGGDSFFVRNVFLGSAFEPGIDTLLLRLDSFDSLNSSLSLANVQFGFASSTTVPEPSGTFALVVPLATIALGHRVRTRRVSI